MANCFVLRADLSDYARGLEPVIRGINVPSTQYVIETVQALLDAGNAYKMVNPHGALDENMPDAATVFDAMNLHGMNHDLPVYMTVGDVIVWNNGKRELCLQNGWACV